jgi:hypothetical protein
LSYRPHPRRRCRHQARRRRLDWADLSGELDRLEHAIRSSRTCRLSVESGLPLFTEPNHWLFPTIGKSRSRQRHRACRLVDDRVPLGLPLDLENWHLNTGLNAYQKRPVAARRRCQTSTCNTRMVEVLREPTDDGWRFWLAGRSRHMIGGHSSSAL